MQCPICRRLFKTETIFFRHLAKSHLQRKEVDYPGIEDSPGLCFCGKWTKRLQDHCRANHTSMSPTEVAHAIALSIKP